MGKKEPNNENELNMQEVKKTAESNMEFPYEFCFFIRHLAKGIHEDVSAADLVDKIYGCQKSLEWCLEIGEIKKQMKYMPLLIEKVASAEFSKKFREYFEGNICKGASQSDGNYSICTMGESGVIDIKGKDKVELIMRIYNALSDSSILRFFQRPSMRKPITREEAKWYLDQPGQISRIRGIKIDFRVFEDALYVGAFDKKKWAGAAAKIVAFCPNI